MFFKGEDSGEDPFFSEDPLDNLSLFDLSELPERPVNNPLIPEFLFTDDTLQALDAATALSNTKRRC